MAPLFLLKFIISFIAKAAWILAIHLIRAGVLELHHCLAAISPAKARNWGEESDFYLGFHCSNSHENIWIGCMELMFQYRSTVLYPTVTLQCLLHSLHLLACKISLNYFMWNKWAKKDILGKLTDRQGFVNLAGGNNWAWKKYMHLAGREYLC